MLLLPARVLVLDASQDPRRPQGPPGLRSCTAVTRNYNQASRWRVDGLLVHRRDETIESCSVSSMWNWIWTLQLLQVALHTSIAPVSCVPRASPSQPAAPPNADALALR